MKSREPKFSKILPHLRDDDPIPPASPEKGEAYRSKSKVRLYLDIEIGVYCITCTVTGSCYIGQSKNISKRFEAHKSSLRRNDYKFIYPQWQEDFNRYGVENFSFETLQNCEEDNLLNLEAYFLKQYDNQGISLYNNILDSNTTIINCPKEFSDLISRIVKGLTKGSIKPEYLERGLFGY